MKRLALIALLLFMGCTEQTRARNFGGTTHIEVKAGQKVIGATWKNTNLWYITRPMLAGEEPVAVTMTESSSLGLVEGHVVLQERDTPETAHINGR